MGDIYEYNKLNITLITMGCGCKNKSNSTPQQSSQQAQPSTSTQQKNQSVQEAIKKTIEKYYTVNNKKQ